MVLIGDFLKMCILIFLMMVSMYLECVRTQCLCNKTATCSSVFECVNCDMGVDNLCMSSNGSMPQSGCLSLLKSSTSSKMVDWLPSTNECRYSECTNGPVNVSISNRTLYWKSCDKGCSKAVVTKHPNTWAFNQSVYDSILNGMSEEMCYRNCLPATSDCITTHEPSSSKCGVYKGCGVTQCFLTTFSGRTSFLIKCTEYECGNLTPPSNGAVDTSAGTRTGNMATYSCNPGYTILGSSTTTCGTNGNWTSPTPTCKLLDCGVPASPAYGGVSYTSTTYQSTVSYICMTGYTLTGSSTNTCGSAGIWASPTPTCNIIDCGAPSRPMNGSVSYSSTTYGKQATLTCNTGYHISGSNITTCKLDGSWDTSAPECTIIDCGPILTPTNGKVSFLDTLFNSSANYSCDAGFHLNGDSSTTCKTNGLWDNPSVTCEIKDCGAPTPLSDGNVSYTQTTYGSQAIFSCNTGYNISGYNITTCSIDGSWNTSTPECTIIDCGPLSTPTNGNVSFTQTTYGSQAIFSCNTGYNISGSNITTCSIDGSWDTSTPGCTIIDCGPLAIPTNGNVYFTDTFFNSSANYSCNIGYIMSGTNATICGSDGNWNSVAPLCGSGDCGSPPNIQNGSVSYSNTTNGSQAFYVCDLGFSITGPSVLTCSLGNTWGSSMPTCSQIDCGIPAGPTNGQVLFTITTYGSSAGYQCDVGYIISGSPAITCGSVGNWNDSAIPSCTIVDCGNPATPNFGTVTFVNTTYNSNASYGCITGYLLSGPSVHTCLATGLWSGTTPQCNLQDCGALSPPLNGQVDNNGTTYSEQAVYSCNVGFNISGPSNRTCQPNGVWSSSAPVCISPGSVTTTRRPLAPLYIMPCICYPNKTFANMTENQILAYLVRETSIDTKNTSAAQAKLNCRPDPRMSSAMIGTVGIIILSTLAALIVCFDLMSVCKRRS